MSVTIFNITEETGSERLRERLKVTQKVNSSTRARTESQFDGLFITPPCLSC